MKRWEKIVLSLVCLALAAFLFLAPRKQRPWVIEGAVGAGVGPVLCCLK